MAPDLRGSGRPEIPAVGLRLGPGLRGHRRADTSEFGRTGFTGGLNWYRAMDLRWEQTADLASAVVEVPAFFLAGERDVDLAGFTGHDPLQRMRALVPDLRELTLIPGAGHLVQLEAASQVSDRLLRFLAAI